MEELLVFHMITNSINESIKVDLRTSTTELEYLDVNVRKVGTKLISYLYCKPTLREESSQTHAILQYKWMASILSAVCSVIQQS